MNLTKAKMIRVMTTNVRSPPVITLIAKPPKALPLFKLMPEYQKYPIAKRTSTTMILAFPKVDSETKIYGFGIGTSSSSLQSRQGKPS